MQTEKFFSIEKSLKKRHWQVGPSLRRGYYYNYTIQTIEGDDLSIDFNPLDKVVRISLCPARENRKEYVTTLKAGTILQSREKLTKYSLDLTSRLSPFANYFSRLQNPALLQAIGGNFHLPKAPSGMHLYSRLPIRFLRQPQNPWKIFKKYIERKRRLEAEERPRLQKLWRRLPNELFDISIGVLLIWIGSLGYLSLTELAFFSGCYGIFCGAVDWVWRQRPPFFLKTAFFVGVSSAIVYVQVQYRMWALYL